MNQSSQTVFADQTDPSIWLKNLEAMYRTDMRFAQELDDLADDPRLVIESARNGSPTMKVKLDDGKTIYLHSRYDPQNEAKQFVENLDLKKNFVFLISGIGLGYQIRELFDRTSSQTMVVILEPELSVIRAALWTIDFSDELEKFRLIFLHRADKGQMHRKLASVTTTTILGTAIESLVYCKQWHADFHRQMRDFFSDFMAYSKMSFITILANCKLTQQNVANNLAGYVCCPPIDPLKRRFVGCPAIIVSAGPSLSKNMHLIKSVKGKAVIIAAQTSLKPLLKMGVKPDFVTSLDYSPVSKRFFEGIEDFGDIHLVAEPKATCSVIDIFKGHKSLLSNEFADLCLGPMKSRRDGLRAGSTVAHLSLYLAEYLGADPIIFIGQDLGFTDNQYYAPGNVVHDQWSVELNPFYTLEMKEWERIARNRDILQKVEDIHGRMIYTDDQMFTYLQQFERDFAESSATIIDATEGGAKKRNTIIMPLAQAIEQYAQQSIPADKFDYLQNSTWFDPKPLPKLREQLEKRINEIKEFQSLCRRTMELLDQLEGLVDQPEAFNKLIVKIDEIRSLVNSHRTAMQMVCSVSANAELRRFMRDRHMEAGESAGRERAINQLSRDSEYLQALMKGSDELIELLEEAKGRVERIDTDGR